MLKDSKRNLFNRQPANQINYDKIQKENSIISIYALFAIIIDPVMRKRKIFRNKQQ